MTLKAVPLNQERIGWFRVFARPPGGDRREITMFRNAPTTVDNFSTADPFTDSTAQLTFPQITIFDNPGHGDLDWLVRDCDIDIVWRNYGSTEYEWTWEGFIVAMEMSLTGSESTFAVQLKGALFALDDYIAKPKFPRRPIPYEVLIQRAFNQEKYPCGLKKLKVTFPSDWNKKVREYRGPKGYKSTLRPEGVTPGQKWTGLTSRSTGSWDPMLTGHVQGLLTVMFDEGGAQWTIRNRGNRRPELFLRKQWDSDDPGILEVTLGAPGVTFSVTKDFSQSANTFYGQGKDEAGITFSGMGANTSGATYFKPYAALPQVYPREGNPALKKAIRPKETMIKFQDGLDEIAAARVAEAQLQRFNEPGFTGEITLQTDPLTRDGEPYPRLLIKAGATMRLKGLQGLQDGLLVHVTQTTGNPNDLTMSLTFDSKYRDVLTVDEVRARTRDALSPLRSLQVGKFSNTIQDLLYPWNYGEGSGMIPSGAGFNSKNFFLNKIPNDAQFPWEEWTTKYPPKDYPGFYIKIGRTNTEDSNENWSGVPRDGAEKKSIPIRMGFAGNIRLTQIAAYDKHGNVMPVRFHASIYDNAGTGPTAMPAFPDPPNDMMWLKPPGITTSYATGQSHPFIKGGWEEVQPDGTVPEDDELLVRPSAGLRVGWGTYWEPAGYSPGRFSRGGTRTGMLTDETSWSWDLSRNFAQTEVDAPPIHEWGGHLFINIYCDEQGDEPVFFMGRLFREEPGTQ
jgi:hypothetical protein